MKRSLSLALSLIMLISLLPFNAAAAVKAPSAPKASATSTANTVTLKWKKVKGAAGYEVYSYKNKKYKKISTLSKAKYTVKKLSPATGYVYAVRAYKKSGKVKKYSKYSKLVKIATKPKTPSGLYLKGSTFASINIGWKKVSGATGYTVKYSTDSTMKNGVKTAVSATNSIRLKDLNDNTSYYYCVSAYKTYAGKNYTSSFSNKAIGKTNEIPAKQKTNINTSKTYQTIDGFGTSAAWNFQKIGGWENTEDILKYLYDGKSGIGLNIYRYNVGAGSRGDEGITGAWTSTDTFIESVDTENGTITYDFTKDAEAQKCLKIAKKLAGSDLRVTLFHNSPPVEMTINGKAYCSYNTAETAEEMETNLAVENYPLYSKFCCDVADYFVKSGYRVTDVSPMNEPVYSWCCNEEGKISQEGCHYTPSQASQLYAQMINAAKGKSYKISMFEAGAAEGGVENGEKTVLNRYLAAIMGNKTNSAYFDTVSMHSYWSDKERKQLCREFINSAYPNMKIACTEYCQMTNDWATGVHDISEPLEWWNPERNGLGIEYGIQMARTIYEDLTVLNCTEWSWWLGVSNGYYPDGLVYIDNTDEDHSIIQTSKRLWCLGNFSKFIEEGAKRIDVNSVSDKLLSCGFINKDNSVVIVYINLTEKSVPANMCLRGYENYMAYVTNDSKDLALYSSGDFENGKAITIPAESVVSVIVTK